MSSLRYKSFCLGITLASVTWVVALYLYKNLGDSLVKLDVINEQLIQNNKQSHMDIEHVIHNKAPFVNSKSYEYTKKSHKNSMNSVDSDEKSSNRIPKKLEKIRKNDDSITESSTSKLEDLGLVRTQEDYNIREEGNRKHAFNVLVSNRLGYHRSIPDTRNALCKSVVYENDLPAASVIICFYNEAFSALLRTIHSVLNRTPDKLVKEILVVDDASELENLKSELEEYIKEKFSSKVKLLRTGKREGLIRARIFGARHSTGEVLVFLDSHCEVNKQWLEPLLSRIAKNRTDVVCPIIDIVNADTFVYTPSPIVRGGFNWGLHFRWDSLPPNTLGSREDFIKPIISPTMAGGLFAIDSSYFKEIGEYDSGMDIWGGENLEISFRIWMCGGSLEIIPCSRVGHIFRQRRPYGSPTGEDTVVHNSLRVANVWMDEYKEYYFKLRPDAREKSYGNITERLELRKRLHCNSFNWYLKNVYPELKPPNPQMYKEKLLALKKKLFSQSNNFISRKRFKQNVVEKFSIRLSGTDLCVESEKEVTVKGSLLILQQCGKSKSQTWFETDKQELLLAELLCLDVLGNSPRLAKCHEMGGSQEWRHKASVKTQVYNLAAGMCLGVNRAEIGEQVILEMCTLKEPSLWDLQIYKPND